MNQQCRLILHFDVNETLICEDATGGDTFEDSLNKIISKNILVKNDVNDKVVWFDINDYEDFIPQLTDCWELPEGSTSHYKKFKADKAVVFTNEGQPGEKLKPIYDQLKQSLRWPLYSSKEQFPFLMNDGIHHFIIPAFFKTIFELRQQGRNVSVVIRTYGDDLDKVVAAINAYGEGKHLKQYGFVENCKCEIEYIFKGRYDSKGVFTLYNHNGELISDEHKVLEIMQGDKDKPFQIICIQDDYKWWKNHDYHPSSGKPLWITESDQENLHIFFDDNIRYDSNNSIVAVRSRKNQNEQFYPLSGLQTIEKYGTHLVRVPTFKPILDDTWFLQQIKICEKNFEKNIAIKKL